GEQIGLDALEQRGELRERAAPVVEVEHDADIRQPVAAQPFDDRDLVILLLKPWLAMIVERHFAAERRGLLRDGPDARHFRFESLSIRRRSDAARTANPELRTNAVAFDRIEDLRISPRVPPRGDLDAV